MEESKELLLKLIFVAPGLLACFAGIYSFIYSADIMLKIICIHLA